MPAARHLLRASLLLAALVGAPTLGCGTQAEQPAAGQPPPAPVRVAEVTSGEIVEQWRFIGDVRSLRSAELALGAGGEVVHIEVREGDRVDLGMLLVEVDKRQASAQLSAAVSSRRESERQLDQARREAERATRLGSTVLASEEIERSQTEVGTLEARRRRLAAEIRAAKAELSDYQLAAPFDGVVSARYVDLGQWVNPGDPVLQLVSVDEVEILVDVLPQLMPHLRVGATATLAPGAGLGEGASREAAAPTSEEGTITAEILGVVPSLDPGTRTLRVRLRPQSTAPWLLPGAPVGVAFPVTLSTSAGEGRLASVLVPRDALVLGAVDIRVLKIVDGLAQPVQVQVEASVGDLALVIGEGLSPGDVVVTRGNERLRPGQTVRVLPDEAPEGGEGAAS